VPAKTAVKVAISTLDAGGTRQAVAALLAAPDAKGAVLATLPIVVTEPSVRLCVRASLVGDDGSSAPPAAAPPNGASQPPQAPPSDAVGCVAGPGEAVLEAPVPPVPPT
jgi:hypothetical protein